MKLLIDIGNTAIKLVALNKDKLEPITRFYVKDFSCETLDKALSKFIEFEDVIISSVVPHLNIEANVYFKSKYHIDPKYIHIGDYPDLKLDIDNPNELGIDLYCDIVAGLDYVSKNNKPVLVIDLGTASKILLINENKVFTSCAILPGIGMSKKMLSSSTALLPEVTQLEVKNITDAKNTVDVINNSVYYGHVEMINGLINRIEKEIGKDCQYIITGGNAEIILKDLKKPNTYQPYLCFEGMRKIINFRG